MAGVNKVIIVGNLGSDPEVRQFQNGGSVCSFSVATSENWKDKNTGERREKTEWHRISIFSEGLVRIASQYLKKGSKVYLEGQLETRKWQDKDGQDRYTTEVVLKGFNSTLQMLDSRGSNEGASMGGGYGNQISGGGQQGGPAGNMNGGGMQENGGGQNFDLDDEIPF